MCRGGRPVGRRPRQSVQPAGERLGRWVRLLQGKRADRLVSWGDSVGMLTLVPTAVVFIIWLYRSRKNADVFARDIQGRGAGWAIGGWFIPIGSLWIPHGVASAAWDASSPAAPDGTRRTIPSTLVSAWWATWVISLVLGRIGPALSGSDDLKAYRQSVGIMLAGDVADIVAAVLAVLFVRKLTHMQHTKVAEGPYATV
ncbi:DUF4328 domain-containing protein [Streptomyces sp. NBC_01180]|nr:DUF4328 domain-containing protein [Streptomyces sp. NBC_01180]